MFEIGPGEVGVLLLCALGVAGAVIGRFTHILTLGEALLALAAALVLPVIGSVISLLVLAVAWRRQRRSAAVTTA